jgi:hypothetical protein
MSTNSPNESDRGIVETMSGPLATAVGKLKNEMLVFLVVLVLAAVILFAMRTELAVQLQMFFIAIAALGVIAYLTLRLIPVMRQSARATDLTRHLSGNIFLAGQPVDRASIAVLGMSGAWESDSKGFFSITVPSTDQRKTYDLIVQYAGHTRTLKAAYKDFPLPIDLPGEWMPPPTASQHPASTELATKSSTAVPPTPSTGVTSRLKLTEKTVTPNPWSFESDKVTITIGRSPDCDVVLSDAKISWHHGFIERTTGQYHYHHSSETNPTIIRRHRQEFLLTKNRLPEMLLQNNDRIVIADTEFVATFDLAAEAAEYVTTEKATGDT